MIRLLGILPTFHLGDPFLIASISYLSDEPYKAKGKKKGKALEEKKKKFREGIRHCAGRRERERDFKIG